MTSSFLRILSYIFGFLFIAFLLAVVVPALLSAKSTIAVLGGLALLAVIAAAGLAWFWSLIRNYLNSQKVQ